MTPEEFDIVQRLTAGQGLSKTALAVYQKAQKYFHRVSQGPFEIQTLALLVAIADVLDEKRLVATTMRVEDDVDRTFDESRVMTVLYQGTFVRAWYCRKGARQRVNVRLDGDSDGETAIPKEHVLTAPVIWDTVGEPWPEIPIASGINEIPSEPEAAEVT